jgi:hypothetical protein
VSGGQPLRFGGNSNGEFLFGGIVDEVRLYTPSERIAEIAALHTR